MLQCDVEYDKWSQRRALVGTEPLLASDERSGGRDPNFSLASDIIELVVLTLDDAFLATLREAVGATRRLWHVPSAEQVSDLLIAGQVGILVIDAQALPVSANVFVAHIKRQFPDLVIIVAGARDIESALAGHVSTGAIYRFIHKPMSPERARLFAEAAVRKYGARRSRGPLPLTPPRTSRHARVQVVAGAGVALTVMIGIGVVWSLSRPAPTPTEPSLDLLPTAGSPQLALAAAALADNRLTAPSGNNALELYLQAVARDPADPAGRAGLADVRERLLTRAEKALTEERLDEAAAAIEVARRAGVDSARVTFLRSQLAKARSFHRGRAVQPSKETAAPTGQAAELRASAADS